MSDRDTRPYGFKLYECWGEFLSFRNEQSDHLFRNCFDGVRLMYKMNEHHNMSEYNREVIRRAELAVSWGKKIHLCLDWFNSASGPNSYHQTPNYPYLGKTPKLVAEIMRQFQDVRILEVCNEPYYTKKRTDEPTMGQYRAYVHAFMEGAGIANFKGRILATQSNTDRKGKFADDAWEWHERWDHKMLEGVHSAVLHDETTPEGVLSLITKDWYDKEQPIGWQHPIYESEFAAGGKHVHNDSYLAYQIMKHVLGFAKQVKMPMCLLTIRGDDRHYGDLGAWPGAMHLVSDQEKLSDASIAIYEVTGMQKKDVGDGKIESPRPGQGDPPDPPEEEEPDVPEPETPKRRRQRYKDAINDGLPALTTKQLRIIRDLVRELDV